MASSWFITLCSLVSLIAIGALPFSSATRAFFIFGDSLVDSGNNNYLITTARADHYPYGIDSSTHHASGRFSNGVNLPDIISEQIGSEYVLPYLSPHLKGEKLLVGANFASAGIGILNDTGIQFENIIRMQKQLGYFKQYQQRLTSVVGSEEAAQSVVNGGLVLIALGGNDFVNNYYLVPYSARSREFSLPDYINYLLFEYKQILQQLYDLGARRVLVQGVGPIGCVPAELALRSRTGACDPELLRVTRMYNPQLIQMLNQLNRELGSDVFIAVNAYQMHMDLVSDPQAYGFVTSKIACCGQGPFNGIGICTPVSNLCHNRDIYVFWDAFHPTERANRIIVSQFMTGSIDYMSPMNLSTILAMDRRT